MDIATTPDLPSARDATPAIAVPPSLGRGGWIRAAVQGIRAFFAAGETIEAPIEAAPPVPLRRILSRFAVYLRPYVGRIVLSVLFIAAGPLMATVSISLFRVLIDDVLVPGDFSAFPPIALTYLVITLLSSALGFADGYLSTWVSGRLLIALRLDFFRHLQRLSLDFFEQRRLGDVLTRLSSDIGSIETLLLGGVSDLLSYSFRILFYAGALLVIDWRLALLSFVVVPPFFLVSRRFSVLLKDASRERRRRSGATGAVAEESLSNLALVQAYGQEDREAQRYLQQAEAGFQAQMASAKLKGIYSPIVSLVEIIAVMLVIGAGAWMLSQELLTLGEMLVFLAFLGNLYSPIRGLGRLVNTIHSATASAERIVEFMDQDIRVQERDDAITIPRADGRVAFRDVTFGYPGADAAAVRDLDVRLEPGEIVALVGASGAGKTTVAKLLLRFYDPTFGRVTLDDHDLRSLTLGAIRSNITVLLQEALVFNGTVRENIRFGRPDATDADIRAAAEAADAADFIERLPDGYETLVGEKGRRLSGGQRQRLAIARALVRDAPVLLLDEPTTGLDGRSAERILAPLRRLMEGRTTIIISHDLSMVREAHRIVVLEAGRIVEIGTHADLLTRDGAYARLYRSHRRDQAGADDRPTETGAATVGRAPAGPRDPRPDREAPPALGPSSLPPVALIAPWELPRPEPAPWVTVTDRWSTQPVTPAPHTRPITADPLPAGGYR